MKILIVMLLIVHVSFASSIDKALFEGENVSGYLKHIAQTIQNDTKRYKTICNKN